jgi:hypothetical protein
MSKFPFLILLCILSFIYYVPGQQLSGHIYDDHNNPLPGANIYIDETNIGVISNTQGYYILKLGQGYNRIIFSFIGYKNDTMIVKNATDQNIKKDIALKEYLLEGETILVFGENYNDAQEIVWKTIQNKNGYLSGIKNYDYDAYQKTVFKLNVPRNRRIIGGIIETHSKGYYEYPDKFQEVVLAKKQSANFSDLTNIFTVGKLPNLLEETIKIDELSIVSPLSRKALDYYKFEMIDTSYFNNRMVFNMLFKPKISGPPLFSGKMSIIDKDFAVVSCELNGLERVVTSIRNHIRISQKFRQYENRFWFPTEMTVHSNVDLGIPGIPVLYWTQKGLISNYRINNKESKHEFDNNILTYSLLSEEEREKLWDEMQSVPLDLEEEKAMAHIDSVVSNANIFKKSILYLIKNFDNILITGFYDFYHYNRVEGNYVGVGFDSKRKLQNDRIRINIGYGTQDQKTKFRFWMQNDFFSDRLSIKSQAFNKLAFLDEFYKYNWSDITLQALTGKNDYADYFYEKGASIGADVKLAQSLKIGLDYSYREHRSAQNNTEWDPFNRSKLFRPSVTIDEGRINALELNLISDNLKYFDLGWVLSPDLSQDFFDINLNVLYSAKHYLQSDFNFMRYHLSLNVYKKFPPYFHFYTRIGAGYISGDFLRQYYFHLAGAYGSFGNPILFRTISTDEFIGDRYLAVALENNFKNTVFTLLHLPYLKNSKLDLLLFTNLGWIKDTDNMFKDTHFNRILINNEPLTEAGVSIGNIFSFLRLDFTWRTNYKVHQNFKLNLTSRLFLR